MMEIIKDLPSGVVGIASRGKITARDYTEIAIPAIEATLENHDKVNILYLMDDFDGMEMDAFWQDLHFGMKHWNDFDRAALVTDVNWMRAMTRAFGWLAPAEIKMFYAGDMNKARAWVCHVEPNHKVPVRERY